MTKTFMCWNCGNSLNDVPLPISRHANCKKCFEVLRCCRMCRHYEPDKRPYCDEERADPPVVKETANFCDFFKPANRFDKKDARQSGIARTKLDGLFDDAPEQEPDKLNAEGDDGLRIDGERHSAEDPKSKLDDLFDD